MSTKRVMKYRIDDRDLELFSYLYEIKVANKEQIVRDVYDGFSWTAVKQRLSKFVKAGLLDCRIHLQADNKYIYSITSSCFSKFVKQGDEIKTTLTSNKVTHDLSLIELRRLFCNTEEVKEYISENCLQTWHHDHLNKQLLEYRRLNTDACLQLNLDGENFFVGLEYESSKKSDSRYINILKDYYSSIDIDLVLYVTLNQSILDKIKSVDEEYYGNDKVKIFYSTIENLVGRERFQFKSRNNKVFEFRSKNYSGITHSMA